MEKSLCDLSDLPEEIKVYIFSYMSFKDIITKVCHVSREFRLLGQRSVVWLGLGRASFYKTTPTQSEQFLKKFVSLFTCLKVLDCCRYPTLHALTEEILSSIFLTVAVTALRCCPGLKKLSLKCSPGNPTTELFRAMETHGKSLRLLGLFTPQLDGSARLRGLTSVRIFHAQINDHVLTEMAEHCPQLETFSCAGGAASESQISDDAMGAFLLGVKGSIRCLQIPGLWLTEASHQKLGQCGQLKYLGLYETVNLKLSGLVSILQLPNLSGLTVNSSSSQIFLTEGDVCKAFSSRIRTNLTRISFSRAVPQSDAVLHSIAETCPELMRLCFFQAAGQVTNAGVRKLLTSCEKLTALQLSGGGDTLTWEAFRDVPINNLEEVFVRRMQEILGEELTRLDIKTYSNVDDWNAIRFRRRKY